jgi:hypothetical protein
MIPSSAPPALVEAILSLSLAIVDRVVHGVRWVLRILWVSNTIPSELNEGYIVDRGFHITAGDVVAKFKAIVGAIPHLSLAFTLAE